MLPMVREAFQEAQRNGTAPLPVVVCETAEGLGQAVREWLNWQEIFRETQAKIPEYQQRASRFKGMISKASGGITPFYEFIAEATPTSVALYPRAVQPVFVEGYIPIEFGFWGYLRHEGGKNFLAAKAHLKLQDYGSRKERRYEGFPSGTFLLSSAKQFFESMGQRVDGMRSEWETYSDNYKAFMLAKSQGKSDQEAARLTPSGQIAAKLGFHNDQAIHVTYGHTSKHKPRIQVDFT